MNAYIYKADLYCDRCILRIKLRLGFIFPGGADPDDETTWDSRDYPKGPHPDGGGEADSPQYCRECGLFLENPLTDDGREYVKQHVAARKKHLEARGSPCGWDSIKNWADFYDLD